MNIQEIVKLMNENGLTLHDIASELGCKIWVWCVEDFIDRIKERNEKFGIEMGEKEIKYIAKSALDKLAFSDYYPLYETMDYAINELIEEVIEETEND